ncbi:hypothetical protein [Miniimonas sp. S16]|uniref:AbiTii domain-containing protein n=1 Tax=Miniimonas sp. S16 TaxID=2171623 RepID=UPI000D525E7F|nr:hypothetical protein [Miniimonas sp. S16]
MDVDLDLFVRSELAQIRAAAQDSAASLADALRRLVALAGDLGSPELLEWAERELAGYGRVPGDEMPDYRLPPSPVVMDFVSRAGIAHGFAVTPYLVGDALYEEISQSQVRSGVRQLEAIAAGSEPLRLALPLQGELMRLIAGRLDQPVNIQRIYWTLPPHVILAVLDQIRTRLIKMLSTYTLAVRSAPPVEAAREALTVVVGPGATVNIPDGAHFALRTPRWRTAVAAAAWFVGTALTGLGAYFAWLQVSS